MWIIKWVELDDNLNYRAKTEFAETYAEAFVLKNSIEEKFNKQEEVPDKLEQGKICSDPILEEIDFSYKTQRKNFQVNELLFCKKCNLPANRITANTEIGVELYWNEEDSTYDVVEDSYILEDSSSVYCPGCMTNLLKQK